MVSQTLPPRSFIHTENDHPFPVETLPYGVYSHKSDDKRKPCVAIGDYILDLDALSRSKHFDGACVKPEVFQHVRICAMHPTKKGSFVALAWLLTDELALGIPRCFPSHRARAVDRVPFFPSEQHPILRFTAVSMPRRSGSDVDPSQL